MDLELEGALSTGFDEVKGLFVMVILPGKGVPSPLLMAFLIPTLCGKKDTTAFEMDSFDTEILA